MSKVLGVIGIDAPNLPSASGTRFPRMCVSGLLAEK